MVTRRLLTSFLSYIFPERQNHKTVREMTAEKLLVLYRPTTAVGFVHLFSFKEPDVRALIHEAKFYGNKKAWDLLGERLALYLKHCPEGSLLIPIPLSRARQLARGYNQAEEVARCSKYLGLNTEILYRQRHTSPQTTLQRKERLKNLTDAFAVNNIESLAGKHVIILDDVATTGATLKAAEAVLRSLSPASITCLALAH